jgi:hypothetical protein
MNINKLFPDELPICDSRITPKNQKYLQNLLAEKADKGDIYPPYGSSFYLLPKSQVTSTDGTQQQKTKKTKIKRLGDSKTE